MQVSADFAARLVQRILDAPDEEERTKRIDEAIYLAKRHQIRSQHNTSLHENNRG